MTAVTHTLAPGHEKAPGVRRILLCPLNVVLTLPAEISSGAAPVYQAIEAYLGSQGLDVQTLGLAEARASWRRAVVAAHESGSPDASGLLAKDLGERVGFDAVVLPSLLLRSVHVTDNSGTWDGVRRRVSMVNLPPRGRGVEADLGGAGRRTWELRPNPSLMVRPDVLREGVQIAFGPYLPPRSER